MKLKVYLQDWMINTGIIGFIRILNHKEVIIINDNYIQFDSKILENFNDYYFDYYFEKYNICEKTRKRVDSNIEYIKRKPEKIKDGLKYIKDEFKVQSKKVEKMDKIIYEKMIKIIENISLIKNIEELDNLKKYILDFLELLSIEEINKKLTLNFVKSVLSDFYGQISFLNVSCNKLSYSEQKDIMYRDYISDIIESTFLYEYIEGKKDIYELKAHISQILECGKEKEALKWYKNINNKYIIKNKSEEELRIYIKQNILSSCTLCGQSNHNTTDYTEGNFLPLGMSSENATNFFYNQNTKMPICNLCKLLMFCIHAGLNKTSKVNREYDKGKIKYSEHDIFNFINYDCDVNTLLVTNNNFMKKTQISAKKDNPYSELLMDMIEQNKEISSWQLENVFIVELDSKYREYSRVEYFNIQRYIAKFFIKYSDKTLSHIKNRNLKLEITDLILKNKDIGQAITDNTRNCIKGDDTTYSSPLDSFFATEIKLYLSLLKKGVSTLEDKSKKLNVLYNIGIDIHEKLVKSGQENKLSEYSYKLLNSINSGDKAAFMDVVIRLHMVMNTDVSQIFLNVMKEEELDFESIGHSFVSGLISNRYVKKDALSEIK